MAGHPAGGVGPRFRPQPAAPTDPLAHHGHRRDRDVRRLGRLRRQGRRHAARRQAPPPRRRSARRRTRRRPSPTPPTARCSTSSPRTPTWIARADARQKGFDPDDASTDPRRRRASATSAAAAVIEYRRNDGANQLGDEVGSDGTPYSDYTFYQPHQPADKIIDPDRWQPHPVRRRQGRHGHRPASSPRTGIGSSRSRWSAATSSGPAPPPKVGSEQLKREVDEVLACNASLTLEQKAIVEFMRDGPALDRPVGPLAAVRAGRLAARPARPRPGREAVLRRRQRRVRRLHRLLGGQALLRQLAPLDARAALLQGQDGRRAGPGPGKGVGEDPGRGVAPVLARRPSSRRRSPATSRATARQRRGREDAGAVHRQRPFGAVAPGGRRADRAGRSARRRCRRATASARRQIPDSQGGPLPLPTFTATAEMAAVSRLWGGYHIRPTTIAGLDPRAQGRRCTAGRSSRRTSTGRRRCADGPPRPLLTRSTSSVTQTTKASCRFVLLREYLLRVVLWPMSFERRSRWVQL